MEINTITNELVSAIIADKCRGDRGLADRMRADCKGTLTNLSKGPVDDGLDVAVVQNTPDRVHVAIPDYRFMENMAGQRLTDEEMAQVAGGEIFIAGLIAGIVTGVVTGVACGAGVTGYLVSRNS